MWSSFSDHRQEVASTTVAAQALAQLVALDLPRGGARQILDDLEAPRQLVMRQSLRQPLARSRHRRFAVAARRQHDKKRDFGKPDGVLAQHRRGLRDSGDTRERVLDFGEIVPYAGVFAKGAWFTVKLAVATSVCGVAMGVLGAIGRNSGNSLVRFAATSYVELVRNTPFLVQLFFIFFGLPGSRAWASRSTPKQRRSSR